MISSQCVVQGAHVELTTLQPYKLSPSFFSDRMRGVSDPPPPHALNEDFACLSQELAVYIKPLTLSPHAFARSVTNTAQLGRVRALT